METPLVSIVVITYNSTKYVLETLESAKKQTYQNIELIISDDGSKDDTVELCREWLGKTSDRFVRTELIASPVNTGIPANANRGYKAAQGKWIKGIAGDDILKEDAIEQFVKNYRGNSYIVATCCRDLLQNERGEFYIGDGGLPADREASLFELPVKQQYKKILWYCFVPAPTVFFNRAIFDKIGYFDEKYRLMEDWPFWLKCLAAGYKIDFMPLVTVYYRKSFESLTSYSSQIFYNENFYRVERSFIRTEIFPKVSAWNFLYWNDRLVMDFKHFVLYSVLKNKKNRFTKLVSKLISCFSCMSYARFFGRFVG